jgi:hypothetical protein
MSIILEAEVCLEAVEEAPAPCRTVTYPRRRHHRRPKFMMAHGIGGMPGDRAFRPAARLRSGPRVAQGPITWRWLALGIS